MDRLLLVEALAQHLHRLYVAFAAMAVCNTVGAGHLEQEDRRLVYAIGISLPFLAVLEACKLRLLFWEGMRQFAPYRVGPSNAIIEILLQMLITVAYNFVGLATASAGPQATSEESVIGSRAIEARIPVAHESLAEAGSKGMKGDRNEH